MVLSRLTSPPSGQINAGALNEYLQAATLVLVYSSVQNVSGQMKVTNTIKSQKGLPILLAQHPSVLKQTELIVKAPPYFQNSA